MWRSLNFVKRRGVTFKVNFLKEIFAPTLIKFVSSMPETPYYKTKTIKRMKYWGLVFMKNAPGPFRNCDEWVKAEIVKKN